MPEKRYKWLPPYNAIFLLSVLAGILVTSAFVYFSVHFFQAEKMISRRAYLPHMKKDALRVLVTTGLEEDNKSPIEVELLSYLSKKLGKEVVPVQRQNISEAERLMARKEFDIAFTSQETYLAAEKKGYAEVLVVPMLKSNPAPQVPISVRKNMDLNTKKKIQEVFVEMNNGPDGRKILSDLEIESFTASPGRTQ